MLVGGEEGEEGREGGGRGELIHIWIHWDVLTCKNVMVSQALKMWCCFDFMKYFSSLKQST